MTKSCVGCVFLFAEQTGYSNYTVTDEDVYCAQAANPHLPAALPYDWSESELKDNWAATADSRCHRYAKGPRVTFDVDGEDGSAMEQIGDQYPHFAMVIDAYRGKKV